LDACAIPENAKVKHYFTREQNALKRDWPGVVWMNPPYGREIGLWMRKAYEEYCKGSTIVCLVPARTDTTWWHTYCRAATEIRFIYGRLKFGDGTGTAPFPSAIVIFDSMNGGWLRGR
jgi:phage N-6-adenine-methyltransferase